MEILKRVCMIIIAIAIPVTSILGAGMIVSRTPDFYSYEFSKLQSIKEAGVSVKPKEMASIFADFINGKTEVFQLNADYNGEEADLFSEKEQIHMADVKTLISYLTIVLGISALLLAVGIVVLFRLKDKSALRKSYIAGLVVYISSLVLLLLVIATDFTAGFTAFHEIFFTNDLWQLNPEQDVLLMIMPEKFFVDGALVVLGISALILFVAGAVIWRFTKERKMFYTD